MTKAFLAIACILGAIACGSSDGGVSTSTEQNATSCNAAADVGAPPADPMARQVSFASDVLPIFVTSCAFGECHGSAHGRNNGVFLGARTAGGSAAAANDAKAIRAGLVGQASTQSPSTPYVTPSDPSRSYLFRKLEGDTCGLPDCAGGICGQPMPRGGDKLDPASLEIVRSWIAQGATDS